MVSRRAERLLATGVRLLGRMSAECWLNVMTEGGSHATLPHHSLARHCQGKFYSSNFPAETAGNLS